MYEGISTDGEKLFLFTKLGFRVFDNKAKMYKFQLQCKHPSSYEYYDECWMKTEVICERCLKCLREIDHAV